MVRAVGPLESAMQDAAELLMDALLRRSKFVNPYHDRYELSEPQRADLEKRERVFLNLARMLNDGSLLPEGGDEWTPEEARELKKQAQAMMAYAARLEKERVPEGVSQTFRDAANRLSREAEALTAEAYKIHDARRKNSDDKLFRHQHVSSLENAVAELSCPRCVKQAGKGDCDICRKIAYGLKGLK